MRVHALKPFRPALVVTLLLAGSAVHAQGVSTGSDTGASASPDRATETLSSTPAGGQNAPAETVSVQPVEPDAALATLSTAKVGRYTRRLSAEWQDTLAVEGLQGGVNDHDLFVSSGSATVAFSVDHPGFIEARGIAYEIAYQRAKIEMIRFLGTSGSREQIIERFENASWARGQPADPVEPLRQRARIEQKLADLTEAGLDRAISELEADYDPSRYESHEQKKEAFRLGFRSKTFATAAAFVAGTQPYWVLEGTSSDGNSYQVLVGLIWTPKLSRFAGAVGDSALPMPEDEAGTRIEEWLPATVDEVVAAWGVKVLANERGEKVLVSFGQAAPRTASPARRAQANETALDVAATRAEGAIRAFVGETLESRRTGDTNLALVEYASAAEGAEIDRTFLERIRAVTGEVELKGLTTAREWVVEHPANGQSVAVAAVAWSPAAVALANRVREAIETRREQESPVMDRVGSAAKASGQGQILKGKTPGLKHLR